jgi:hemerythrin superfamily protein
MLDKNSKPIEDVLIVDHNEVKFLYDKYKICINTDDAKKYFNQIAWEVARHAVAEEIVLYPVIRERVLDGNVIVEDALNDDRLTKQLFLELESMDHKTFDFESKFKLLMVELLNHIEKEEKIMLPNLIKNVSLSERIDMAKKFENRKLIAPTRPHPWTSDRYPFLETLQGVLLAPIDKFMDLFKSFPSESETSNIEKQATSNLNIPGSSFSTST